MNVVIEVDRDNDETSLVFYSRAFDESIRFVEDYAEKKRQEFCNDFPDNVYEILKREISIDKIEYWLLEDGSLGRFYWTVFGRI